MLYYNILKNILKRKDILSIDMYRRLRDSLFNPKGLCAYRHDRWYYIVIFLLILTLIQSIPTIISVVKTNALSYETKQLVRSALREGDEADFRIENGQLICTGSKKTVTYELDELDIVVTVETYKVTNYAQSTVVLQTDGVYLYQALLCHKILSYSDYASLEGLDLSLAHQDNGDFWATIYTVLAQVIDQYKANHIVFVIAVILILALIETLFYIVVLSVLQRLFTGVLVTFGDIFRVCTYTYAPTAFLMAFENLLGLGSLVEFMGLLITVVYLQIAVNKMIKS